MFYVNSLILFCLISEVKNGLYLNISQTVFVWLLSCDWLRWSEAMCQAVCVSGAAGKTWLRLFWAQGSTESIH